MSGTDGTPSTPSIASAALRNLATHAANDAANDAAHDLEGTLVGDSGHNLERHSTTTARLLTRKDALSRSGIVMERIDLRPAAGEVILKVDRVALTTNNITYAAFGDAMGYWNFFPTQEADWGHMPAWGFADIVASAAPGVEVGERFFGYFPLARHLRVQPERISERGFYDGAEHRRSLTSAYNQYTRCSRDPAHARADENILMLVRPLFVTSYMLADFLQDNAFFGARRLVISSASSKTAYGTAFCLQDETKVELTALTSERNRNFVETLGCYHRTVTYGDLESIAADQPTLYVDFSGDEALRARVHRHFGPALVYDCYAGSAQNTQFLRKQNLPGPDPKFFFAPTQIRKRNADWGYDGFNQRFNSAQQRFIRRLVSPSDATAQPWMQVIEHRGLEAARKVIAELHDGKADPAVGHVVVLGRI
jgi:hypothetical protein